MKRTVSLKEKELRRMIAESVRRAMNESNNFEGSEGIVEVLEKNGLNHTAARATEGAITYIAGIKNHDLLTKMAQYIQRAVDDEYEWTMRDRTYF